MKEINTKNKKHTETEVNEITRDNELHSNSNQYFFFIIDKSDFILFGFHFGQTREKSTKTFIIRTKFYRYSLQLKKKTNGET